MKLESELKITRIFFHSVCLSWKGRACCEAFSIMKEHFWPFESGPVWVPEPQLLCARVCVSVRESKAALLFIMANAAVLQP